MASNKKNQPAPKGSLYKWQKDMIEYQLFPESYFAGADVKIYFGDTFIDDIVGINFVLQEQIKPLYSYNSRTFKECARGNRMVQGMFAIAFRQAGYISAVMDHIGQLGKATDVEPEIATIMGGNLRKPWHGKALQRYEEMLRYYSTSKDGISNNTTGTPEVDEAAVRYASYEREIWGRRSSKDENHENQTFFFTSRVNNDWQKDLAKTGFDIYFTYGPIEKSLAADDSFGGITQKKDIDYVSFETTVKALRGVQLYSLGQDITSDGLVIEVYNFIAQDLD